MVTNITSLTGNGLRDWLIQRVTAVYFAIYIIFLMTFFLMHMPLTYQVWSALFHDKWFIIASLLALLTLTLHTWVGVWTVTTDYITCTAIRISVQLLVLLWLLVQFIWCLMIVWG